MIGNDCSKKQSSTGWTRAQLSPERELSAHADRTLIARRPHALGRSELAAALGPRMIANPPATDQPEWNEEHPKQRS